MIFGSAINRKSYLRSKMYLVGGAMGPPQKKGKGGKNREKSKNMNYFNDFVQFYKRGGGVKTFGCRLDLNTPLVLTLNK